jgi:hypothetical protein
MREPVPSWEDFGEMPEPGTAIESGDLKAALAGFATRHLLDYRRRLQFYADGEICGFGSVLWLMGDHHGAAEVWATACDEAFKGKFRYSSSGTFQPGLLLWFASVWLKDEDWHDEASALLDKLLRKKYPVMGAGFSILLARLLRGEIELREVQATYRDDPPHMKEECEWEALFYAGVRAFEKGNVKETRRLWKQAKPKMDTDSSASLEYYLMEHERKKFRTRR